jgi:hypothetical protein
MTKFLTESGYTFDSPIFTRRHYAISAKPWRMISTCLLDVREMAGMEQSSTRATTYREI